MPIRNFLLALAALAASVGATATADNAVVVNGRPLDAAQVQASARAAGQPPRPGRYWYDARAGMWGVEGGPVAGFAAAGQAGYGELARNASGGNTGVFFNGRELRLEEVLWLRTLGPVWPGRYGLDAWGNVSLEGHMLPFANLYVLAHQRGGAAGGGNSTTKSGTWIASGGGCTIVAGKSSSGIGSFSASSC